MLGHPVAHSLSPVLHRAAYDRLGLDWTFEAVDVTEDGLAELVVRSGQDPSWRGLALTMPLKRAVLPLLDRLDDSARTVGAANTLLWEPDGSRTGANTDVPGLVAALAEAGGASGWVAAVVLGGGATAASAVVALAELGVRDVCLRVRDPARAGATRAVAGRVGTALRLEPLDADWGTGADVVVSTLPSAVAAAVVPGQAWWAAGGEPPTVVDVVYDPWPSTLLQRASAAGARTVTGVDVLVHQAVRQVTLMTGRAVDASVLREAAHTELRTRPTPGDDRGSGR